MLTVLTSYDINTVISLFGSNLSIDAEYNDEDGSISLENDTLLDQFDVALETYLGTTLDVSQLAFDIVSTYSTCIVVENNVQSSVVECQAECTETCTVQLSLIESTETAGVRRLQSSWPF